VSAQASGPTVYGATRAVIHAVGEERGNVYANGIPQVQCRRTLPAHFSCSFLNLTRALPGRVSVVYMRGHYYVGEPRYERPREAQYEGLCGRVYEC
jgi:hypothetical protein